MSEFKYIGSELELFAAVHNWKSYWSRRVRPFIRGDVLEVGAGIGANTPYLNPEGNRGWVCLEPDPLLVEELTLNLAKTNGWGYEVVRGTLQNLRERQFDTILYIDVLEHIENDRDELTDAASLLRAGGRLIVLAPAHQWLFTPFDAAIGHFRRYDGPMLRRISPAGLQLEKMSYLDSAGLLLSASNRLFLRQAMPTKVQLSFWDKRVIPVSQLLDKLLLGSVGKSIIGIWRRVQD